MPKPTIKDVAREAGVSPALVSLVLNGKNNVSRETAERVTEVVHRLGYRPNKAASRLRSGRRNIIGVITPSISNHYFSEISRNIENIAYGSSYTVLFGSSDESPEKMGNLIDTFMADGVGGLLITPCEGCADHIRRASEEGIPVVLMNRDIEELDNVGRVFLDNRKAISMCIEHLIESGREHIAMVSNTMALSTLNLREKYYAEEMEKTGLGKYTRVFHVSDTASPSEMEATIREAAGSGVEALIIPRGYLALEVFAAIRRAELRIPEDIALIGFDGGYTYSLSTPTISQIFQDTLRTADEAFNMLMAMMGGSPTGTVLIEPGMIPGGSTVPVGNKAGNEILIPASLFTGRGGWTLDQQFMDQCGSSVLLAHGLGKPVDDARTPIVIPEEGTWHLWVRTRNWTAPFSDKPTPGTFCVRIDDQAASCLFGTGSAEWHWQYGGSLFLKKGSHTLHVHDLKGFDARFCSIFLSLEPEDGESAAPEDDIAAMRKRLLGLPGEAVDKGHFDLVVVGGGVAGMCAAIAAARLGLKVALIQDRKVLGGNNSSEVRVGLGGRLNIGKYPSLGYLLNEFGPYKKGNARPADVYEDERKMKAVLDEKNITLILGHRVTAVRAEEGRIKSVTATDVESYRTISLSGENFADCTGDAVLGVLAGADWAMGREAKDTYGEPSAPETADGMTLGASMQWYSEDGEEAVSFPDIDWGLPIDEDSVQKVRRGQWYWEVGMADDQIADAETIRDYGMYAAYSNWSFIKNHASFRDEYRCSRLEWLCHVIGKRESRRLLGDYVLTENDLLNFTLHPDGCVSTSWYIDNHEPDPENAARFERPWLSHGCLRPLDFYPIPLRCFYSRNIENLFMAGRDISVSHLALGTTRVMRTCAMMGEVVGLCAAVCHRHGITPREAAKSSMGELEELMKKGAGRTDVPYMQVYTLVDTTGARSEDC